MPRAYSTAQAARELGLSLMTMHRYIRAGKVPAPPIRLIGNVRVRLWSEKEVKRVRDLLPNIPDGRKTRYQAKHAAAGTQPTVSRELRQSAKSKARKKKPQPGKVAPHKKQ